MGIGDKKMKHKLFKLLKKTIIPEDLEEMVDYFLIAEHEGYYNSSPDERMELRDEICELIIEKLRS